MSAALVIIFGIILAVVVHEFAHFAAAKAFRMQATEAFFGFGPKLWSTRRGETEYGVKLLPLGGYVRITGMNLAEEVPAELEARTYRGKPFWQKAIVVLAGILANLVLAFLIIYLIVVAVGLPDPDKAYVAAVYTELADGRPAPAAAAGLQPGDRFVSVDGLPAGDWGELVDYISARPDQPIALVVQRGDQLVETTVVPALATVDGEERGFIGVERAFEKTRENVLAGIPTSAGFFGEQSWAIARGLGNFLWPPNLFKTFMAAVGQGEVDPDLRPSTPIGLVKVGSEIQRVGGWEAVLGVLASFNIIVAFFNVLPLYPLDGGHFAVALWERVRGRPVDVERLVPVAVGVIVFFLSVFLLGLWFDFFGPPIRLS